MACISSDDDSDFETSNSLGGRLHENTHDDSIYLIPDTPMVCERHVHLRSRKRPILDCTSEHIDLTQSTSVGQPRSLSKHRCHSRRHNIILDSSSSDDEDQPAPSSHSCAKRSRSNVSPASSQRSCRPPVSTQSTRVVASTSGPQQRLCKSHSRRENAPCDPNDQPGPSSSSRRHAVRHSNDLGLPVTKKCHRSRHRTRTTSRLTDDGPGHRSRTASRLTNDSPGHRLRNATRLTDDDPGHRSRRCTQNRSRLTDDGTSLETYQAVQQQLDDDEAMARQLQEEMDREYAICLNQRENTSVPSSFVVDVATPSVNDMATSSVNDMDPHGTVMHDDSDEPAEYDLAEEILAYHYRGDTRPRSQALVTAVQRFVTETTVGVRSDTPRPSNRRPSRTVNMNESLHDGNNYEFYLNLAETVGEASQVQRGLTKRQIDLLPCRSYVHTSAAASECSVCMCEFKAGNQLRILPCFHEFHVRCIDKWILKNATCPVCRVTVDVRGCC